jgi:hypothetical protein
VTGLDTPLITRRSRYIPKFARLPTSGSCRKQSPISIATVLRFWGIRRGTASADQAFARSIAKDGVALAKRHDRSGGKLSRILLAMQAREAFLRFRETITDSWLPILPRQASIPSLRTNNASRKVLLSVRQEEIPRTVASSPQLLRAVRGEDSDSISLGVGHPLVRWKLGRNDRIATLVACQIRTSPERPFSFRSRGCRYLWAKW